MEKLPICLGCGHELGDLHASWCPYAYWLGRSVTLLDTKPK